MREDELALNINRETVLLCLWRSEKGDPEDTNPSLVLLRGPRYITTRNSDEKNLRLCETRRSRKGKTRQGIVRQTSIKINRHE